MTQVRRYLTAGEVADRVGVSTETIRRWAREGKVDYFRLPSGSMRFPADQELLTAYTRRVPA